MTSFVTILEDFYQIMLDLLKSHDTDGLLNTIINSATRILDAPYVEILLPVGEAMVVHAVTANQAHLMGEVTTRNDVSLGWEAIDSGQPRFLDDYTNYPKRRPVYSALKLRAVADIPIMVEGRCMGLMAMARDIPNYPFSPDDIRHAVMLAQLAGVVLERNALHQATLNELEERKKAEETAIQLGIERQRSEMLSGFIRDASHEFRTPLSIIQTSLYLLNKSPDPEMRERKTRLIEQQVRSIDKLVDMLGLQANIDSQLNERPTQRVNLNALAAMVIEGVQSIADANQQTLTFAATEHPVWVNGDAEQLNTALRQLADNALRYTPSGGEVQIIVSTDRQAATIAVKDNGIGIAPEAVRHIFTRFYRDDAAHSTPGFGLGLSIVAGIVERHGGHIIVESKLGMGSTFTLMLPMPFIAPPTP